MPQLLLSASRGVVYEVRVWTACRFSGSLGGKQLGWTKFFGFLIWIFCVPKCFLHQALFSLME
jgi:hypothetical protein